LDVIKQIGPRGNFLAHKHTRTHLRLRQFSGLTAQPSAGGGYRDPQEVACDKIDWILANHHPLPLDGVQKAELTRILATADREANEK